MVWYYMIYLLTAVGLTPGCSSTVHIYTQTIHRTTQSTHTIHGTKHTHISMLSFFFWNKLYSFKGDKIPSLNLGTDEKKDYFILYYIYIWTISQTI
jgi:hypothetical protein